MKNILFIILISCFSLIIISWSEDKEESTTDTVSTTSQMGETIQGME